MKTFALSKPFFPFTTIIVGFFLGSLIVVDHFLTNLIAQRIDLTINGLNILKLYPYELSSLLFLFVVLLVVLQSIMRHFLTWTFTHIEKAFIILFLFSMNMVALTKISRIDLSELLLFAFFFILLLKFSIEDKKIRISFIEILNLLFISSLFISSMNAGILSVPDYLLTSSKFVLILFLITNFLYNRELLIFFLKCFVIISTISAIIGIGQEVLYVISGIPIVGFVDNDDMKFLFEPTSFGKLLRVPAFFRTYKPFTFFLNTAMLIIFNYFIYKRPFVLKMRLMLIFSFLLMFFALSLTFSKDALLAFSIGLILSTLIRWPFLIIHGFVLIFITIIAIYVFGFADDIQRTISTEIHCGEMRIRLQLGRDGILGFVYKHPWIGVGVRDAARYTAHYLGWPTHNAFIMAADVAGISGLLTFLVLLFYTLLNIVKSNLLAQEISDKWVASCLLSGFIATLIAIQFHPFFLEHFTWLYMGVVQAYIMIAFREKNLRAVSLA